MQKTIFLLLFIFLTACHASPDERYQQALTESVSAPLPESLVCLKQTDTRVKWDADKVLLVTWHNVPDVYQSGATLRLQKEMVWAVSLGELEQKYPTQSPENNLLRLTQLFGMPPNHTGHFFSVFSVEPEKVLRPAYAWQPDIQRVSVSFDETTPVAYRKWFDENEQKSQGRYPWTRLGYTYDWGSEDKTKYGLSEFVIPYRTVVHVHETYSNEDFIKYLQK